MKVTPGTHIGPYEVRERIGAGGMGEVWLGHDAKLRRDAALKVLPEDISSDHDRLARFRREAQVLAALNHPNIATIYGLHEEPGQPVCLAMEFVAGSTLAEKIQQSRAREQAVAGFGGRDGRAGKQPPLPAGRGPVAHSLPLDDALGITTQICDALEHAHEKGIVHRDLKPANVKVTPEGKVKVLDFGLAKALLADPHENLPPDSQSPTVVSAASPTIPGMILGTAAYMSPEQAKGKPVDRRTDIWALGCVLFEMLTGRAAFEGESVTEILGAVMRAEPEWSLLPADTPPGILALLRRCMQKDSTKRSRDAGELRLQLDEARNASSGPTSAAMPAAAPRRWLMLTAAACVTVALLAGGAVWKLRPPPPSQRRPVERLTALPPRNATLLWSQDKSTAISADGSKLAFVASGTAGQLLYVRPMDSLEATPLSGTEGAYNPFFSPDGQWIGFASGGALKKVAVSGGAPLTLCPLTGPLRGASWTPDNFIIFAQNPSPLMKVSASGGQPEPITTMQQGETNHRWPQVLPDGKTLIYTIQTVQNSSDENQIAVQRIGSTERKILLRGGTDGRVALSAESDSLELTHLVYYRAGTLMAVPFDLETLELKGATSPAVESVLGDTTSGVAQYSFSNSGALAYLSGGVQSTTQTMVWVNRLGVATPLPAPTRTYRAPRLSPDGRQIAVGIGSDIWLYDIPRDTLTRLTFENSNAGTAASWTPDGRRVVFPSNRAGPVNLFWKPVDGSGPEERLTTSPNLQRAGYVSPDGHFHIYTEVDSKTASDLWVFPMQGDRKPRVFLQTPFAESSGAFSPDGHWVAYVSNESGQLEVYVRPFPGPGGKWQISTEGGSEFYWNPKGKELFYRTGARKEKMMVVEYETQPTFTAGKPRLLFEGDFFAQGPGNAGPMYSVSPDGQRFLMTKVSEQAQANLNQINLVLNWFEELKRKVPVQ